MASATSAEKTFMDEADYPMTYGRGKRNFRSKRLAVGG
jgi:hypothetical protein